jgi:hypothetical protein
MSGETSKLLCAANGPLLPSRRRIESANSPARRYRPIVPLAWVEGRLRTRIEIDARRRGAETIERPKGPADDEVPLRLRDERFPSRFGP